jgi:hypothetical protein
VDNGLVFATTIGSSIGSQNIINRHFKPLLRIRALPYSCLVAHPKLDQDLLSHSSIQLTLDRYSHWMPLMGRSTADGMDKALG